MRVILIDDEHLALEHLGKKLEELDGVEIIGKYTNPYIALEEIRVEQPDAVFLDIEMPEMNGLEMAKEMKHVAPDVKVVFVTAYGEYAVDAFEINAVDYIVKPIRQERLKKTMNKLFGPKFERVDSSRRTPMICCFHKFHFKLQGQQSEVIDVNWRTTKARELFAYLVHHRGKFVRKADLLEYFWSDSNSKDGFSQLYSTIYQIRKTLKGINFPIKIINFENTYRLELNGVLLDVDEWEDRIKSLTHVKKETIHDYKKALDLYKGDYFEKDDYWWAENEQKRLRLLWLEYVKKLADYFMYEEDYTAAIMLYLRAKKVQPFEEDTYFMLMQLYDALEEGDAVKREYGHLKAMLKEEFGTLPRDYIENWYRKWEKQLLTNQSSFW